MHCTVALHPFLSCTQLSAPCCIYWLPSCSVDGTASGTQVDGVLSPGQVPLGQCYTDADCRAGTACSKLTPTTAYNCVAGLDTAIILGVCVRPACQICKVRSRSVGSGNVADLAVLLTWRWLP